MRGIFKLTTTLVIAVSGFMAIAGLIGQEPVKADGYNPNCGTSAVVKCGAYSNSVLQSRIKPDARALYGRLGISANVSSAKHGIVYPSGDVKVNGKTVATHAMTFGRVKRNASDTAVRAGGTTFYKHTIRGAAIARPVEAFVFLNKNGQFTGAVIKMCGNPVVARNVVPNPPAPVAACKNLTQKVISRTERQFTTTASVANGATISGYSYNFGDGKSTSGGKTVNHNYSAPGNYTAKVTVKTSIGDRTGTQCQVAVKIEEPKVPAINIEKTINTLEHDNVEVGEDFTYELVVTNTGEVDLKNAVVTDAAPENISFVSADKGEINDNVYTHTIPELKIGDSQTMIITAKVTKYFEGTIPNTACVDAPEIPGDKDDCDDATVETDEDIKVCDLETGDIITIDKSEAGDSRYTTDYDLCAEPEKPVEPETPAVLPETGVSDTIASVFGLGSLVATSYYYVASRRTL